MILQKVYRALRLLAVLWLLAALAAGCSATKKALGMVSKIDIAIKAEKDVNPDAQGNPSPVMVRFYELSDVDNFRKADFATLVNNEQTAIGNQIIERDEFVLKPEEHRSFVRRVKPDTRYIGILAAYHNEANIKWRAVLSLNTDGTTMLVVYLGKSGMTVSKE
ncbi:MAG: type VI secretion system lipoprotein TssJ [Gammaproteobacteria bacterium]|nr:type VI secretion system lipoprotein TssJ [Gammaproteobacteria bacterium]